jgi:glycosyltransferase involved in cell wall biosynthesis
MSNLTARAKEESYVLMTAAYNEEAFIEETIKSVLSQTLLPQKWVIVSDNSTDGTDAIVEDYARQNSFIHFVRVTRAPGHDFRAKVMALQKAGIVLDNVEHRFIGNLDADVTLGPTYFETLVAAFERLPKLGIASGYIYERANGQFRSRPSNRVTSVPHAAQLMRRECYETIGGYSALKYGGEDWYAQICAQMNGWDVEALPQLPILHHKPTGAGANLLRHRFRLGRLDYSFGSHPAFELVKCLLRLSERPLLVGAVLRWTGFCWCHLSGEPRAVTPECAAYLRREQTERFLSLFRISKKPSSKSTNHSVTSERLTTY